MPAQWHTKLLMNLSQYLLNLQIREILDHQFYNNLIQLCYLLYQELHKM